jgi:hypothetical protein
MARSPINRHVVTVAAALALSLAGAAAPAIARPLEITPNGTLVLAGPATATQTTPSTGAQAVPPAIAGVNGFDWGDAGIGALGGLALTMTALGGGLAVSQRHGRRTHHRTA